MYEPCKQPGINEIYNLLFCDDLLAFSPKPGEEPAPWQSVLFEEPIDADRIRGRVLSQRLGLVLEWWTLHQSELAANWQLVSEGREPARIEPLE